MIGCDSVTSQTSPNYHFGAAFNPDCAPPSHREKALALEVACWPIGNLQGALREHVNALAVDIGPRTSLNRDSLVRAANYIRSVFEEAGLSVREQERRFTARAG